MLENKKLPREHRSIRIHPTMLIGLKRLSDKTGLTFSELIRDAIEQYLLRYEGEVKLIYRKDRNKLNEKRK